MHLTCTALKKYVPVSVLINICLLVCLAFAARTPLFGRDPSGNAFTTNIPDSASVTPASYWGPLPLKIISPITTAANDPIRFSIQCDKQTVRLGDPVDLTITAELMNISPNLLFFQPGSSAYTLKVLLPPGFEQTGGDLTGYVTGELSYPVRSLITYHVRGYFSAVTPGTSFRLLRGQGQSGDQGLFVEKAAITLKTGPDDTLADRRATGGGNLVGPTLLVLTDNGPATGSARAATASYQGYLDYASCTVLSGWIIDRSDLRKSQEIDIYINGVKVATVLADRSRQDVANAIGVNDFNQYGYTWLIPDNYKNNAPLTLSVRPAGTSTDLAYSPYKTGTCPGTGTIPSTPPATTPPVTVAPPVTPPVGGALMMLAPTYNCATGAITFNTSGGDGTAVRFKSPGITDWTTNPNQFLDAGARIHADTPPFTLMAEQSGRSITYIWSRQTTCNGTVSPVPVPPVTTPPVTTPLVTVVPPVTPPTTGGALMMLAPTYNCATGAITFNTSGGDGTAVRFKSPGITDWTTNPNQFLDAGSRVNADTPPFTIFVQQLGNTITYIWSRQATCNGTTPPATTPPTSTPPPVTVTPSPTTPLPTNSTSGYYGYRGDNFNYDPLPASDPNSDPLPVFETDKIKVTLALRNQSSDSQTIGLGGAVYQIYNKQRPGHTLVYNPLVWNGEDQGIRRSGPPNRIFTGQGLSECLYQLPRPYYGVSETNEPPENPSLGYNPNEVGDDHANSGRLQKFGRDGNTRFYTEMTPMLYGQVRSPANDVLMKKWGEVKDRALILNYETTFNRSANERVVSKVQESPCLYVNNLRIFKYYNGDNPYSGDGITTFTAPASSIGNGNSATSSNGQRAGGLYVTEPWIGIFGEDGYGIALMLKDNVRSFIGYWGDGGGDAAQPNKGGSYGYIAHAMKELLDMNIRWRHRTEVIVGTVDEIRAYVYANSYRPATRPSFKFNTAGREGWSLNSGDGSDRHTWDDPYTGQARNGWKVYFGASNNATMSSPGVTWKANEFNKIYIRMAYTGSETQWSLRFRRNRQKGDGNLDYTGKYGGEEGSYYPDGTSDRAEQTKMFSVKGDGQFRVYEIDLSQNPEWRNVINEIYLKPHAVDGKYNYNSGESAIIDWIDANPNGPSN